ncbi:hypothetical protein [Rhodohalobacter sulfatireducens]|uniref:IrrE N-terminal-like domain-containing protein n=1 Tax=Rhodohalobacter sulfatireducens TaxID=2911366 RepID=A0ABS9KAD2_9BACT|nr:hypothetical protein [Rhodohalobacter sulfatireducens]MCG2587796.1 hypothetical protein [Rhodohalobacter sulfatireducens]
MPNRQARLNFEGIEDQEDQLNELFYGVHLIRKSVEYLKYLDFITRFKRYSIFNTSLVYVQKPETAWFATPKNWRKRGRRIKEDARPLVMLQPGGPIMFVYDVNDTYGENLPESLFEPFRVEGDFDEKLWYRLSNSIREFKFKLIKKDEIIQRGGAVARKSSDSPMVRFEITINNRQKEEVHFQTVVHELAHVFCGHLGSASDEKWPDRRDLNKQSREFEAESVSYLVCRRQGLDTKSDEYLAQHINSDDHIPQISIEKVLRSADWIEKILEGTELKLYRQNNN